MKISLFDRWTDNAPKTRDLSWEEFCAEVIGAAHLPVDVTEFHARARYALIEKEKRARAKAGLPPIAVEPDSVSVSKLAVAYAKKSTPAFSPAEYPSSETRGNAGALQVHLGALDFDKLTVPQTQAVLEWAAPYAHAGYTSFSHGERYKKAAGVSFRLVFRLDRPVPAAEWEDFWLRLWGAAPAPSDDSCKDPARLYGLPATPVEHLDVAEIWVNEGVTLCVDTVKTWPLPPAAAAGKTKSAQPVADSLSPKELRRLARKHIASTNPDRQQLGRWIDSVCRSEPYATTQGERHKTMLRITAAVERAFPNVGTEALAEHFRGSLEAMARLDDSFVYHERYEAVVKALEGARDGRLAYEAEKQKKREQEEAQALALARGDGEAHAYTDAELEQIAEAQSCKVAELRNRWIVQKDGTYYFLTKQGYRGPCSTRDAKLAAHQYLAPAPIELIEFTPQGRPRSKPLDELTIAHGMRVDRIVADLTVQRSMLVCEAGEWTMHEATAKLRRISPRYDEKINQWLRLLGGAQADKLLDWLATVTDLTRQTCALYLIGVKGAGKTEGLLRALARLWDAEGRYTELDRVLDNFNEDLARCPFTAVDEGFKPRARPISSIELRSLIGNSTRTLARKFMSNATLKGAIRILIAANNDRVLDFREDLDSDDIEATAQRILHVHSSPAAATYIQEHAEPYWFTDEGIVAHIQWLIQNRKVVPGKRFLVEGNLDEAHRRLATGGELSGYVCEWLARYLSNPAAFDGQNRGKVQLREDGLWLNSGAIAESWGTYLDEGTRRSFPLGRVTRAVAMLSVKRTEIRFDDQTGRSQRLKFHKINPDLLLGWIEEHGIVDLDLARAKLGVVAEVAA